MTPRGPHRENSRPAIYTTDGDLVFVDQEHDSTSDFKPQTYRNKTHLTFSHGYSTGAPNPGHGYGKAVSLNNEYRQIEFDLNATMTSLIDNQPGNLDFHEHIMSGSDTLFVTAYNNTPHDLSPIGGSKDGWLANSGPMTLRLDKDTADAVVKDNMTAGSAINWLRYMEISRSSTNINLDNLGLLTMQANITGTSRVDGKSGTVNLNYHHEENIFTLWRSLRFGDNLQAWLEQNARLPGNDCPQGKECEEKQ